MRKDRYKALELRRKNKSYNYISKKLEIPKSTLSGWFSKSKWSQEIAKKLHDENSFKSSFRIRQVIKANKIKWEKTYRQCEENAKKEFPTLKNNPLFIAGIMLYWGEGNKTKNSGLKLGNSDPSMISVFYNFLTDALKMPPEKISAGLILYPDLIDSVQKNMWSNLAGIPLGRFTKSTYIQGRHPKRRLSYGVCIVSTGGKGLKRKMAVWIDLFQKYLNYKKIEGLENISNHDRI